jgi:Flp pilus assembly protein TadB
MAQTKKKRSRKHRGTAAGTIERAGRTSRPKTREEAKKVAKQQRAERLDKPPTWRSATNRAAIAAIVFGVLVAVVFGNPVQALPLGAVMFLLYIPLGYATDSAMYRFRQRRKQASGQSRRG